jgi:hypothetical protein
VTGEFVNDPVNVRERYIVGVNDDSLINRTTAKVLSKLNVDSAGRLRVSAESVASHAVTLSSTSIASCETTAFAGMTIVAYEQQISKCGCFRSNLVVS